MSIKQSIIAIAVLLAGQFALAADCFVTFVPNKGDMSIVNADVPSSIIIDEADDEAVKIAASTLSEDFGRICGTNAKVISSLTDDQNIIVGTMSTNLITSLLSSEEMASLAGKHEKFLITIKQIGKSKHLVIAGSDRRGTIYGIYELSRQMGVSPWYWWADVPTVHHKYVGIFKGLYTDDEPSVEYRGIFINDEWPCFGRWTNEKFGGFNSKMYAHLFELILRLRGNYLWPAMWGSAFYDDDVKNGELAHKMGIVMGTSHHEPMALNQQDWKRRGTGAWDFNKNQQGLSSFWRYGVKRSQNWETFYTIGMRGDGDTPMEGGTNVKLMEDIVACQRNIIEDISGRKPSSTPQLWALYKEVQDFYDQGMNVPDDVTLLLCDDNWGNVRRLPSLSELGRKGGYGMYYHFDYVGAPRNSKWMSINPIPRVWEQLNLTYCYGVKKLWIVNVGDLKLQEYPTQFFMDMAWRPEDFSAANLMQHTSTFYSDIFGEEYAPKIAKIMWTLWKQNRIVTPEQLSASTFSFNYDEWPRMVSRMRALDDEVESLYRQINQDALTAYEELVYIPVKMVSNMYQLFYAAAMNKRLYKEKDSAADLWANEAERLFALDEEYVKRYHKLADGKWNHHMDQPHIGYTAWNEPEHNNMPELHRLGLVADGSIEYPNLASEIYSNSATYYAFKETDKYVAMEAAHTSRRNDGAKTAWLEIPDFGKTLSGITTWPCTSKPQDSWLEYDFDMESTGNVHVVLYFAPTLNYNEYKGLSYTVSVDNGQPKTVNINKNYRGELGQWQKDPIIQSRTIHNIPQSGPHTLRVELLDPGMVLEKVVINAGGVKNSHLGPPETLSTE